MRPQGLALVVALLGAPLLWLWPLATQISLQPLVGQYLGVVAITAMAIAQLLATRMRWLEHLFGGLDRIYLLHKWLGLTALGAMLLHDGIGAEIKGAGVGGLDLGFLGRLLGEDGDDAGEELGEIALNGILVLVGISMLSLVPYRWWHWTHKLMGALFALSLLHVLLVKKVFALDEPLGLFVLAAGGGGIASYLWTLLPFGRAFGAHAYRVMQVIPQGDAMAVVLERKRCGIGHQAGQFAFLRFDAPGLGETHPFTISSAPVVGLRTLRFTIKPLGSDTRRLVREIRSGLTAHVTGPYGRFLRPRSGRPEVWIAGGIGITPFIAWAEALSDKEPSIRLLYSVDGRDQAAHIAALDEAAKRHPSFSYRVVDTRVEPRLTAETVAAEAGAPLDAIDVAYCGPKAMREALHDGLVARGLKRGRFRYEHFELRSTWPVDWVARRLMAKLTGAGAGA